MFRLLCLLTLAAALPASAQPLRLALPTSNTALLDGAAPDFYQHTKLENGKKKWWGGKYGFVRNARQTAAGTVYTRFHEGIDIAPRYRDRSGAPLDTVRAIDTGIVVYANSNPRTSAYGKYVVIEHFWNGSPFYSLYAHLSRVQVAEGERIGRGEPLGRMGYTGNASKSRAHLHLEINMLLSSNFDRWYARHYPRQARRNTHAAFNGMNLAGLNVAALYVALQADPTLTMTDFLAEQEPFFTVLVDADAPLELLQRYPLLRQPTADAATPARSWAITFDRSGLPLSIAPSERWAFKPVVTHTTPARYSYATLTRGLLSSRLALSSKGERYLDLLTQPYGRPRPVLASMSE